jgi:hypothetical protein
MIPAKNRGEGRERMEEDLRPTEKYRRKKELYPCGLQLTQTEGGVPRW